MVSKCNESNRSAFVTDELRRESLQVYVSKCFAYVNYLITNEFTQFMIPTEFKKMAWHTRRTIFVRANVVELFWQSDKNLKTVFSE